MYGHDSPIQGIMCRLRGHELRNWRISRNRCGDKRYHTIKSNKRRHRGRTSQRKMHLLQYYRHSLRC